MASKDIWRGRKNTKAFVGPSESFKKNLNLGILSYRNFLIYRFVQQNDNQYFGPFHEWLLPNGLKYQTSTVHLPATSRNNMLCVLMPATQTFKWIILIKMFIRIKWSEMSSMCFWNTTLYKMKPKSQYRSLHLKPYCMKNHWDKVMVEIRV